MAIEVALAAHADEASLAEDLVRQLSDYRGIVAAARSAIASAALDREQRREAGALVEASMKFLDSVIENRRCTAEERHHFGPQDKESPHHGQRFRRGPRRSTRCTARSVRGGRN